MTPPKKSCRGACHLSPPAANSSCASSPANLGFNLGSGGLLAAAIDQEGSLKLQRALSNMSPARLQAACEELAPHLGELCTHIFGNYLVSRMAALQPAQPALIAALTGRVVELMKHAQGSRVVQAALDALPPSVVGNLIAELQGHVVECAETTNGSWSVVAAFKHTHASFIVAEVASAVMRLSTQQSGTRVVQRILPEATSHEVDVTPVLRALVAAGPKQLAALADDQYGNYVVQISLRISSATPVLQARLVELMLPSLPSLSTSKAGSNVAEMLISCAGACQIRQARDRLDSCATDLSTHCFGKHVMQTLQKRLTA